MNTIKVVLAISIGFIACAGTALDAMDVQKKKEVEKAEKLSDKARDAHDKANVSIKEGNFIGAIASNEFSVRRHMDAYEIYYKLDDKENAITALKDAMSVMSSSIHDLYSQLLSKK